MTNRIMIGCWSLFALPVLATIHAQDAAPPCNNCCKGYYEKTVTAYKRVVRLEQYPVVVKKPFIRYETRPVQTVILVPQDVIVKKPREVTVPEERIVQRCRKVPIKLMDPDTGCCIITYKDEFYPVKICVPVTKIVMDDCKVRKLIPQPQTVMKSFPVQECRDETVMMTRERCEMVPYQKVIRLPCPPMGPNYRVPVPLDARDYIGGLPPPQ